MGNILPNVFKSSNKNSMRILMLGLDAAGKTTVLYRFKLGEETITLPTIGFNVEDFKYKNIDVVMWDVGGQDKIRKLLSHYYNGTNAMIFVIDASDTPERLEKARDELNGMLQEDQLKGAQLLVYANKQDLPGALSGPEITKLLGLDKVTDRNWIVQETVATKGDGLYEGIEWLATVLRLRKVKRKSRSRKF